MRLISMYSGDRRSGKTLQLGPYFCMFLIESSQSPAIAISGMKIEIDSPRSKSEGCRIIID